MIDQPALGFFATYQVKVYFEGSYMGTYKFRSQDEFTFNFRKDPKMTYKELGYVQCSEWEYAETVAGPMYDGVLALDMKF